VRTLCDALTHWQTACPVTGGHLLQVAELVDADPRLFAEWSQKHITAHSSLPRYGQGTIEAITLVIRRAFLVCSRLSFLVYSIRLTFVCEGLHDCSLDNNDGPGKQTRRAIDATSGHQSWHCIARMHYYDMSGTCDASSTCKYNL